MPGRIVVLVPQFPKLSEPFIVSKVLGLWDRGVDLHVVTAHCDLVDLECFPTLAQHPLRRTHIHAWLRGWRERRAAPVVVKQWLLTLCSAPRGLIRALGGLARLGWRDALIGAIQLAPLLRLQPDLVHLEFGAMATARLVRLLDILPSRLTVSFRGFDINYFALDKPEFYQPLWKSVDGVHFLGADLRNRARCYGFHDGIASVLIPPAVDAARFRPCDDARAAVVAAPIRILSVGRLHWKKGYEYSLGAMRLLLDRGVALHFDIIGDGPFRAAVECCIADLSLQASVTLSGARNQAEIIDYMRQADLFLHAAVSEGFCNAVLEAQAMGLPVVCSDADGLAKNVVHGETGLVTGRRSSVQIADAIAQLAQCPSSRRQLGRTGRQRVIHRFAPGPQIDAFERFFNASCS